MAFDVNNLQARINSMVAQDPTPPTQGDSSWNLYLMYLNMAQQDWQESYQWPSLYKEVNTMTSQATGNATLSLPADFRKIDGFVNIADGGRGQYAQVLPDQRDQFASTSRYFYILGSPGSYSFVLNPASLGSGASIFYSYWASAMSLASAGDVSQCPDPTFLVERALSYYWESMNDPRYQQARADSDRTLTKMLEFEMSRGESYDNRVKTREETNYGFRIGKN